MRDEDTAEARIRSLRQDLEEVVADGGSIYARQQAARALRFNLWPGQSEDGRKYDDLLDGVARPFNGASDARVPLIDGLIQDLKDTVHLLFFRAQVQAVPVEAGDAPKAQAITTLLRWLRDRAMREELEDEVELAAEHMFADDPALAIIEVGWRRDTNLERRPLSLDDLAAMFATGAADPAAVDPADPRLEPEMLGEFADLATNPARAAEFLGWLGRVYPLADPAALRAAARELRKTGRAELPVPVIRESRPGVQALRYMEEVFFSPGVADIQRAARIHRLEWVGREELRERAFTLGWDAESIEHIIERGGGEALVPWLVGRRGGSASGGSSVFTTADDELIALWWSYERRTDNLGVMGVHVTVWSEASPAPLKEELRANRHGRYPFVARPRERTGRQLIESRGLTRALGTHQTEIKVQRDARSNFTQLTASPPYKQSTILGVHDLILAPNQRIPVEQENDIQWFPPPGQLPQASIEMERTTRDEAEAYAGRMTANQDPNRVAVKQQRAGERFFQLWREVFSLILSDAGDFYTPTELARVTGSDGGPAGLTPEDLTGRWDTLLEIDSRDLNMEYAMKKLEALTRIMAVDSGGTLDRTPIAEWAAFTIDPVLARRSVRPAGEVTAREIKETKDALTQMAVGIQPDMPVQGINAPLRLQVLQQTVQGSASLQQALTQGGAFAQLVETYQKYLQQQVAQSENRLVGRLGVAPVQGGLQSAALGPGGGGQ